MWGREMRAGLVFVVAALLAGGSFREWRRSHDGRFQELIEALEAEDAAGRLADRFESGEGGDSSGARSGAASPEPRSPAVREIRVGRIDVNRATAAEIERLPGIGPSLAQRIVSDRAERGAFPTAEALLRVRGIGPRILERIRGHLLFSAAEGESTAGF